MYTCQLEARVGFAAVISQCCDLEPRQGNRINQPTIAVARILPVPKSIIDTPGELEKLRSNSDPRIAGASYLNLFHIVAHPAVGGQEWMADFGQVFSIPSDEFPAIMPRKVLQMDDGMRIQFKIRLAASFARFTEEEYALNHPWLAG